MLSKISITGIVMLEIQLLRCRASRQGGVCILDLYAVDGRSHPVPSFSSLSSTVISICTIGNGL